MLSSASGARSQFLPNNGQTPASPPSRLHHVLRRGQNMNACPTLNARSCRSFRVKLRRTHRCVHARLHWAAQSAPWQHGSTRRGTRLRPRAGGARARTGLHPRLAGPVMTQLFNRGSGGDIGCGAAALGGAGAPVLCQDDCMHPADASDAMDAQDMARLAVASRTILRPGAPHPPRR